MKSLHIHSILFYILTITSILSPYRTEAGTPKSYLCLPEKQWTCNSEGRCSVDSNPNTLMAYNIDIPNATLSRCNRNGKKCDLPNKLFINRKVFFKDNAELVVSIMDDWHGQIFKIDGEAGKFATSRLSGGLLKNELSIISTTGSCIER